MAEDNGHINADLLALADDDESDSDVQDNKSTKSNRSPSPRRSHAPETKSKDPPPERSTPTRESMPRRRHNDDEDAASGAESSGSAAMSESESDAAPSAPSAPADTGSIFPVDGRFRDETERARIMALPEVERESFLADRSEEIQQAAQSAQLRQIMASRAKQDSQKKRKADVSNDEERKPKRTAKTKSGDNIANYKRMREEKMEQRRNGGSGGADRGRSRNDRSRTRSSALSDRGRSASSEEVEWDDRWRPSPVRQERPPTKRDFDRVKVGRTNFAKVCYWPHFEEKITGCFCRVAIGLDRASGRTNYRMTQIKGFKNGREYEMEAPNGRKFKTSMYLVLAHGKSEKEWPFQSASDGPISQSEYERYLAVLESEGLRIPPVSALEKKLADIVSLLNHTFTDAEITEKLRRQGWAEDPNASETKPTSKYGSNPIPIEPNATSSSPPKPLNGAQSTGVQSQQERLAALNSRNRRANAEEIRKAQIEERKAAIKLQEAMSRGEAKANPFARVKTKARVHYDADGNREKGLFGTPDVSRAGTPAAGEKGGEKVNGESKANGANGMEKKVTPMPRLQHKKRVVEDEVLGSLDLGIDVEI